ncbi:MAG: hypothetical protein ACNS63_04090 [Candidatus Nitrospinota bacterium M3_3B_026]
MTARFLAAALILAALPSPAAAFYDSESGAVEARALVRALSWFTKNPGGSLYENATDQGGAALGRLMVDARPAKSFTLELNAYQLANVSTSRAQARAGGFAIRDVERSSALEWRQRGETTHEALAAIDRLNLRITSGRLDFIAGRQAINLATCYYFTPNDFFAPFAAQTFYRIYKPGVDAARLEARLGPLTQVTLIAALGYSPEDSSPNGWSGEADWGRTSYIARVSTVFFDFDWALIGGKARDGDVAGGAVQGELFWKTGLRVEGNYMEQENGGPVSRVSAQLEKRFESSLILRVEGFYNSAGAEAAAEYTERPEELYPAKWYSAAGLSYEFNPLLRGEALALFNHVDGSRLLSFYTSHSVSDETEVSMGLYIPFGGEPGPLTAGSEFGSYPASFTFEIRSVF